MLRMIGLGILAAALPLAAFAAAVAESVRGDVQAADRPLAQGQRVAAPTAITTGPGAQVFLRFEDDMQIVLGENSLLRVVDFRHTPGGVNDRAAFELLRGTARVVTGKVAANNSKQFFVRTPQTQLSIEQPADFTVALVNPAYVAVKSGTVVSSNGSGTVSLGTGSTSVVAGSAGAPAAISSLPANVSPAISNLAAASVGSPAGGAAAGATTAAPAAGSSAVLTVVVVGIAIAAVAAAAAANEDEPAQQPTTTHH